MPEAESLPDFLKRTAEAPSEPFLATLRARAKSLGVKTLDAPAELARMKAYIVRYYEGVRPVASFFDHEGHVVDCIPFDQQPAARSAREAGQELLEMAPPPAPVAGAAPDLAPASHPSGAIGPCPPGTVPTRRINLEELVASGTLEDYFRKSRP